MGFTAIQKMNEWNQERFQYISGEKGPKIPEYQMETDNRKANLADAVKRFLIMSCEELRFDEKLSAEEKWDVSDPVFKGNSAGEKIPVNMEKDIDRLCLVNAMDRFIASGTANDAFDVYFCYLEMFVGSYRHSRRMIELLSEFETNSSSLLMKHRDHYSHSVYVFALGLAIYETNANYRNAYCRFYGFKDDKIAAAHFLKYWGMSSLFHDIGYPFELPFEQVESYFAEKGKENRNGMPFLAYHDLGYYTKFNDKAVALFKDLYQRENGKEFHTSDELFAYVLEKRLGKKYHFTKEHMRMILATKPANPDRFGYFMDHGYFSATVLLKELLLKLDSDQITEAHMDALSAIILHNSLYKFSVAFYKEDINRQIKPDDHPLAYLLMLCDELQCWDRTSYGRNSRTQVHPFGCDFTFADNGIQATYLFDEKEQKKIDDYKNGKIKKLKAYSEMEGKNNEFQSDIERILALNGTDEVAIGLTVSTKIVKKDNSVKHTYLSDSNFLHLYNFAVALNAQYDKVTDKEKMKDNFETLSLEYKLSNVAQAKEFAAHLNEIHCFYTDKPVDFEMLDEFGVDELKHLGKREHERWGNEKKQMCWLPAGEMKEQCEKDKAIREQTRMHFNLGENYEDLDESTQAKDTNPLNTMIQKLYEYDGLRIYRL